MKGELREKALQAIFWIIKCDCLGARGAGEEARWFERLIGSWWNYESVDWNSEICHEQKSKNSSQSNHSQTLQLHLPTRFISLPPKQTEQRFVIFPSFLLIVFMKNHLLEFFPICFCFSSGFSPRQWRWVWRASTDNHVGKHTAKGWSEIVENAWK